MLANTMMHTDASSRSLAMADARRSSFADPILAAIVAADDPTDVRIKAGEELDVTLRWNHNGSPGTRSAHTLDLTFDIAPFNFGAFGADSSCRVTAQPFVGSNAKRVIE